MNKDLKYKFNNDLFQLSNVIFNKNLKTIFNILLFTYKPYVSQNTDSYKSKIIS